MELLLERNQLVGYTTDLNNRISNVKVIYGQQDEAIGFDVKTSDNYKFEYFYLKNLQGDITGICNSDGGLVLTFSYDAFGQPTYSVDGGLEDVLISLTLTPFLYRGYMYDHDVGLYYLQSRFYNPLYGRFLNADETDMLQETQGEVLGANLFAYCNNNPIMFADQSGNMVIIASSIIIITAIAVLAVTVIAILTGIILYFRDNVDINSFISSILSRIYEFKKELVIAISLAITKAAIKPPSKQTNTHHIVAQNSYKAIIARTILESVGIDINDDINLIELNVNFHNYLHTNAYYCAVNVIISDFYYSSPYNKFDRVATGLISIYAILYVVNLVFF